MSDKPLPKDIGGYQALDYSFENTVIVQEGDLWVQRGMPLRWVGPDEVGHPYFEVWVKAVPGVNLYRKMACPKQGGHDEPKQPVYMFDGENVGKNLPPNLDDYEEVTEGSIKIQDILVPREEGTIEWAYGLIGRTLPDLDYRVYRRKERADHLVAAGIESPRVTDTTTTTKLSNPKDLLGSTKVPLHLFPSTAVALGSLAFLDGALKYGRGNWRVVGVRASIYYDAGTRHMTKWFEGEDIDPDSGLPHLAHALACIAILIDADAAGKLEDDRAVSARYAEYLAALTPHVGRLQAKHAGRDPKHYTIKDSQ